MAAWSGLKEGELVPAKSALKFTYEDYRHTPEDHRYELIDGELIMAPAPRLPHQRVARKLGSRLIQFVEDNDLGEVFFAPSDVLLSNTDVVQPDILFVSNEREHLLLGGDNVRGGPDLVVEILSPSTAGRDRTVKRTLYARHGVREYWLVDPDAGTVMVLLLSDDHFEVSGTYGEGETATSPILEGFSVSLDEIF